MNLANSQTKENLMRAFAGECQAHMRYDFGANLAKREGFHVIEKEIKIISTQEIAHSNVFYKFLREFNGQHITLQGAKYPVDLYDKTLDFLKASHERELEEHDSIYKEFADVAAKEGFMDISYKFKEISEIEKLHADRFIKLYNDLSSGMMFKKNTKIKWFCTNCGHVHESEEAPEYCPVCSHPRGYFTPYTNQA
ncbi:rubrerythrin [Candidatus Arthromitus sp. SFB-mouse-Japan]|uniref:rubrerythrin n=1 Tax=Candidatus Arthromitus sp. SFB-mouse TaxID=49118 RepID=UPI00021B7F15|nr:rubrerythrin family protein [Candidatus Arthromitus sp. SFB-mouse]EIA24269.1 Rubrerythrin [Candidatus Arthromitus sp. SFB-2]EIA25207.1 Rubrerythrin [Candidatus Arthromitus sp. SFB-3]EIA30563.1 Rubrerythrin [Candidatus Arthromitus sp. SFB-mouse-SU]EGX29032.1 rubrerythrin/rubredoxin domain-containing protein [Candidatus Arthromitus sp. SFB-mouse-NYU]BAK56291.1 rubrerythrin [Candidatus Arthromitus sp. SFB-mouse-Japan]